MTQLWFAWYPVKTVNMGWTWLRTVEAVRGVRGTTYYFI